MALDNLVSVLEQLHHDCPATQGAVLASADGLVVAASGLLNGDAAAASAAQMVKSLQQHLSLIRSADVCEVLVWTAESLWYCARTPDNDETLLICAEQTCKMGALRMVAKATLEALLAIR